MRSNEWMICATGDNDKLAKHSHKTFPTKAAAENGATEATRETGQSFLILEPVAITSIAKPPVTLVHIPRPVEPKRHPAGFGPHGVW
jgi:hypothetical protein